MEVECLQENVEARSTQDGDQHYLEAMWRRRPHIICHHHSTQYRVGSGYETSSLSAKESLILVQG